LYIKTSLKTDIEMHIEKLFLKLVLVLHFVNHLSYPPATVMRFKTLTFSFLHKHQENLLLSHYGNKK